MSPAARKGLRSMELTTITDWAAVSYDRWAATCDTLHAHTQVLGKLAVALARAEPELHHAALRLTARGWETEALRAPDGSGALVVALDLRVHEVLVEHTSGATEQIPLTPNRAVGDVTRDVLAGIARVAGPVFINAVPQETPWSVPLDGTTCTPPTTPTRWAPTSSRPRTRPTCSPTSEHRSGVERRRSPPGGHVRSRGQPVLRPARRPVLRRLHRPQLGRCGADRGRVVARRSPVPPGGLLRVRVPCAGRGVLRRPVTARRPLRPRSGRVPPGLGRRAYRSGSPWRRAPVRSIGVPPRQRPGRMG